MAAAGAPREGAAPGTVDVAVVGAGFSGLGAAIRLRQEGFDDLVIFERGDDVGGTWRDNTYPGAACDVPSKLYSFSFAPNPGWSRSFSAQPEIQQYLRGCAERFGLLPHLRLSTALTSARWVEEEARWHLQTTGGPWRARILILARGPLSEPALPDLPGLSEFGGTMFHSSRWDHGCDLTGRRVAVIGTGASAVQFVPEIAGKVAQLHLFQRTPAWILPRRDRRLAAAERWACRRVPGLQRLGRAAIYWGRETFVAGFVGSPARRRLAMRLPARMARAHLRAAVADPDLRRALTPDYEMGCKRILLSDDFYPALTRPNVELVPQAVAAVRPGAVVAADGTERPVDTIIFGTGFDVTGHGSAEAVVGRHGASLAEAWARAGRPAAYRGTTVAGFPNLFLLVGPNSGLGHTSIVFVIESQLRYVVDALRHMRRHRLAAVEVRPEAQAAFTARVDAASRSTVWTSGGCASYYLDAEGRNIGLWPGSSWGHRRLLRAFDPAAYRLTAVPRAAPAPRADAAVVP